MSNEENSDDLTLLCSAMTSDMEKWLLKHVNHEPLTITKGVKTQPRYMGIPSALIVEYECKHSSIYRIEVSDSWMMKEPSYVIIHARHSTIETSTHKMECTKEQAVRIQNIFKRK